MREEKLLVRLLEELGPSIMQYSYMRDLLWTLHREVVTGGDVKRFLKNNIITCEEIEPTKDGDRTLYYNVTVTPK